MPDIDPIVTTLRAARSLPWTEGVAADALRELRIGLLCVPCDRPDVDAALADLWRACPPVGRTLGLRSVLGGVSVGPALGDALVAAVDDGDASSADAALHVLADADALPLDAQAWRRLGRVARAARAQAVPERDVVPLLARRGPAQALPTLALAAFRPGPEDAEDRLAAIVGLGRFAEPRAADWVQRLIGAGSGTLECLHAVAQAMARLQAEPDEAEAAAWAACLQRAAGVPSGTAGGPSVDGLDAWVRWSAIDGLCHLQGSAALPWVLAAWRAAGDEQPDWYLPALAGRAAELAPAHAKATLDAHLARVGPDVPALAPLPGLAGRVMARCPRIARSAMVEWLQARPDADGELVRQRAAVEKTLVARGQILGSFLPVASVAAAELGPAWAPNWQLLADDERAALIREEAAWLDG